MCRQSMSAMLEVELLLMELEMLLTKAASERVTLAVEATASAALPLLQVLPTVVASALLLV